MPWRAQRGASRASAGRSRSRYRLPSRRGSCAIRTVHSRPRRCIVPGALRRLPAKKSNVPPTPTQTAPGTVGAAVAMNRSWDGQPSATKTTCGRDCRIKSMCDSCCSGERAPNGGQKTSGVSRLGKLARRAAAAGSAMSGEEPYIATRKPPRLGAASHNRRTRSTPGTRDIFLAPANRASQTTGMPSATTRSDVARSSWSCKFARASAKKSRFAVATRPPAPEAIRRTHTSTASSMPPSKIGIPPTETWRAVAILVSASSTSVTEVTLRAVGTPSVECVSAVRALGVNRQRGRIMRGWRPLLTSPPQP